MADDQYIPVVDSRAALLAVDAAVEIRRGYLTLVETLLAPFPIAFEYDQKKRNQMVTLLSRGDTLWVLLLIYSESSLAPKSSAKQAERHRRDVLGAHLTRAALAKGIAIYESNAIAAKTERRHTVAASRIVEASLAYGLIEAAEKPDEKQQPFEGTKRLAQFVHALGDHAYWTMKDAIERRPDDEKGSALSRFEETQAAFERDGVSRQNRSGRITADDAALSLLATLT